jgi:predicted nucleotidyltransferase
MLVLANRPHITWEEEKCIAAGHYLESKLWPLGEVELVGSAKKGKAYDNNRRHDIDVVLMTIIEDTELITSTIVSAIKADWATEYEMNLDIFCYGNFSRQVVRRPLAKDINVTIYYNRPEYRVWEYLRTITYKFWQSLLKR